MGLLGDVSKAYYSMLTGLTELHVRRVVWRPGRGSGDWTIFGFQTVSMGDRPAACQLEVIVRATANMFGAIDDTAANPTNYSTARRCPANLEPDANKQISDMIDGFFKLVKMLWQCKLV